VSLSPRSPVPAIGLGLSSHVLAGLSPFVMSAVIVRLGLIPGMALVYGIGAVGLVAALAWPRGRATVVAETRALWSPPLRRAFTGGLAGFLVAGVAYYVGLERSPRVAEYIFLTRLDWILQAPVAILLLREPWTGRGLAGGALALAGGIMLVWTGAFGPSGLAAALVYILASLAGYACFTPISASRGVRGAATLTVWRHWINALGFAFLLAAFGSGAAAPDASAWMLAGAGAVVIVVLFLLRFTALTGLPLWVLSVQAPVQAMVAVAASLLTGAALPLTTVAAISMIVIGEVIVTSSQVRRAAAAA